MHLSRFLMNYMYQILFTYVHSILYVSDCVIEESAVTIIYPLSRSKLRGLPSHPAYTIKQHLQFLLLEERLVRYANIKHICLL